MTAQAVQITEHGARSLQPASETAAILHMIERAARDPSIDIDRMRELLAIRKEIVADEAKERFNIALAAAQAEMQPVSQDCVNPQTRSKYASLGALDQALRPIYSRQGLSVSFDTADGAPENHIRVICIVALGRHERIYHIDMPADGKGAKGNDVMTKTHATMSAVSYSRRGLLKMVFNISEGQFDDDGNAAAANGEKVSAEQIATIQSLIVESAADIAKFCKYMKVDRIENIPAPKYDEAVRVLEAKRRANG